MKVLITGGAGYMGCLLVPALLEKGHSVTVLDNFCYQDNTLALHCLDSKFDIHRVDCRDVSAIKPFLHDADVVIPLAALVGAPICNLNPIDAELLNVKAHIDLFAELSKDQLVINPSTESVYGRNVELCTEETPCNPLVSYGHQKLAVEKALTERGANSISFRLATLFGMSPRMRLDLLINDFVWRAMKDRALVVFEGKAVRTCTHVRDAVMAFVHCLEMRPEKHEIYNVGSVVVSKLQLCAAIKEQVPYFFFTEAQYGTDPDARDYTVSDDKIRATGYAPTMQLAPSITELLKGYKAINNTRHGNV